MLGRRERYAAVPFFWTQHYDVSIDYLGHAQTWDQIDQDGDIGARDVALRFRKAGCTLALATIFRGRESLLAERAMEQGAIALASEPETMVTHSRWGKMGSAAIRLKSARSEERRVGKEGG